VHGHVGALMVVHHVVQAGYGAVGGVAEPSPAQARAEAVGLAFLGVPDLVVDYRGPVGLVAEVNRDLRVLLVAGDELTGLGVQHDQVAGRGRQERDVPGLAVQLDIRHHRDAELVHVPFVRRDDLVVPLKLAGIDVDSYEAGGVQVSTRLSLIATATAVDAVPRRGLARAPDDGTGDWLVRT